MRSIDIVLFERRRKFVAHRMPNFNTIDATSGPQIFMAEAINRVLEGVPTDTEIAVITGGDMIMSDFARDHLRSVGYVNVDDRLY